MKSPIHPAGVSSPNREDDLRTLESYLDDELSDTELAALRRRLAGEPALAEALSRMCSDFALRQAYWSDLEPSSIEVASLGERVRQANRRHQIAKPVRRALRVGAAVAACVVCFLAGWIGRGTGAVAATPAAPTAAAAPLVYEVALTDESGNITAIQKFANLADAQAFAVDVGRLESPPPETDWSAPVRSGL